MGKVALIGIGYWGKNLLRDFSKIANISVCSSQGNKKNIEWIKKKYPKIKFEKDSDKIFKNKDIDAVIIATPINSHYKLVQKSLKSKKHVFIEKPVAMNYSQAKKLFEIAKKNKLLLFTGYIFLYHPIFKKIEKITKKEKIRYIEFNWEKTGKFSEDILLDLVSHCISMCVKLIGIPKKNIILNKKSIISKCDIVSIRLLFSNKVTCLININRCSAIKRRNVKIFTEKNNYQWDENSFYKFNFKKLQYKKILDNKKSPLIIECKEFVDFLNKKKFNNSNVKNSIQVMQILDKIRSDMT